MKKNRFLRLNRTLFLLAFLSTGFLVSCKEDEEELVRPKTITDVILENEQFTILKDIMLYTKMNDALRANDITLFAPSNEAFGRANMFSANVITAMPVDSARQFLLAHIVPKYRRFSDLKPGFEISLARKNILVTRIDSTISVNQSDIVIRDVNADNGRIHVIDSLLVR